jgi:glucose-6-phosphate 1-dehydrogenase
VTIIFHEAPQMLFQEAGLEHPDPNHITIRIQPNEGISLTFDAKVPGPEMKVTPVKMDFFYQDAFMARPAEAYERLLHDAMEADHTLFLRADEIERAWEILDPVLDRGDPEMYPAGSWGPKAADDLVSPGRWYLPPR